MAGGRGNDDDLCRGKDGVQTAPAADGLDSGANGGLYPPLGRGAFGADREYDVGDLVSAKGIAEGVSNSNWLVETTAGRFILTMYERRIDTADLPFFLGLLDHLSAKGCPVPRTIHDRSGAAFREIGSKAVALIEFLPGVSIDRPNAGAGARSRRGLGRDASRERGFHHEPRQRDRHFAASAHSGCSAARRRWRGSIPIFPDARSPTAAALREGWPWDLPQSQICHTDLFPDNVLMRGDG
jgi:homoserine kinase type II